jgi:hypothetical protein
VFAIVQLAFHHSLDAGWEEGRRVPAIALFSIEILAIAFTLFSVARSLVLFLDAEQREWLRLMLEADWYG